MKMRGALVLGMAAVLAVVARPSAQTPAGGVHTLKVQGNVYLLVGGGGNIAVQVRAGVQAKVRAVMPMIVREEVTNYLNALFASNRRPGRPRKLL